MKRLPLVCLWILLSLIVAMSAAASTREAREGDRGEAFLPADRTLDRLDARNDVAAPGRPAESAAKTSPFVRKIAVDQEIGDGQCFEYVLFGFWHVWAGCGSSGGGGGGGW